VCVGLQGQTGASAQPLRKQCRRVWPRMAQVIDQPGRRVCHGAMVPAPEKRVSLFAPHPQSSVRRKTGKPVACGRTVWLEAVEGGLLSGDRILAEAGQHFPSVPDSLVAHAPRCGRPPQWLAADRGVSSVAHEAQRRKRESDASSCHTPGRLHRRGALRSGLLWCRRGRRCRAGLEGRIRGRRRRFGWDRCRDHGEAGPGRWVGWGMVTANRIAMARTMAGRSARRVGRAA
jgi:hypothetical protein